MPFQEIESLGKEVIFVSEREKRVKDDGFIYRPYITRNGVKIYPKNSRVFKIPIDRDKKQ